MIKSLVKNNEGLFLKRDEILLTRLDFYSVLPFCRGAFREHIPPQTRVVFPG